MRPFKTKGYRAKEVLDLVNIDLCGPIVGKWCAAEGSEVSEISEGCDHGFQKF